MRGLRYGLVVLLSLGAAHAGSVLVGASPSGANTIPFSSFNPGSAASRYQQVYAAANFSQPISITGVDFFATFAGTLRSQDYELWLSTTAVAVDNLDLGNFGDNVGADAMLFAGGTLSGMAPAVLSFTGVPFFYNPASGNLLVDFRFSNGQGTGSASFAAYVRDAAGLFSRATDFTIPAADIQNGYGLQTRFDYASVPEPPTLLLSAAGIGLAIAVRRRRTEARA